METYSLIFDPSFYANVLIDLWPPLPWKRTRWPLTPVAMLCNAGRGRGAAKSSTYNLHTLFYFIKYVSSTKLLVRLFSVQASSAPIERVFSHAGLILSSRRTNMTEHLFRDLVFLRVNQNFLWIKCFILCISYAPSILVRYFFVGFLFILYSLISSSKELMFCNWWFFSN